jgi:ubiquinone/menaquinone biosynthesis C-methylase UbiE
MANESKYSEEPRNRAAFTRSHDQLYTRFANLYDTAVKTLPVWKAWLGGAIPHIQGPRVLEVSFGTGYLLTRYAAHFETYGIDYNRKMVQTARKNLKRAGVSACLRQGDVESLPYEDESFDSVVNTMSFSGYPDGAKAMGEMHRVLKEGGRLILIDVNYPSDGSWLGTVLVNLWKLTGDIIRDMGALFDQFGLDYTDQEIGGYGSVHIYVATKGNQPRFAS